MGWIRSLRRDLGRDRPDLVHTALYRSTLVGRLAAAGTGIPVLTSLVGSSYDPPRLAEPGIPRGRVRFAQLVDRLSGRFLTSHFHAVSETAAEAATRRLGVARQRISVVPRGRDPERLGAPSTARRERVRATNDLPPDAEVVLTAGRLEPVKGQADLLRAAAILARRHPRLVVLVAGKPGAAAEELAQLVDGLRLGSIVRLLGHREDVADLLAAADLYVTTSHREGLPGAVLEALALELPIVASDIPAHRDLLAPDLGAELVPPGDPAALATAIDRALRDPSRRELAKGGRRLFLSRYTAAASAHGMVDLYHALLASGTTIAGERERTPAGSPRD